jgi:hypothetical protein
LDSTENQRIANTERKRHTMLTRSPKLFRLTLALALPMGLLALSSPARANARKVTNGSDCQFTRNIDRAGFNPGTGDAFSTDYTEKGMSYANAQAATKEVTCNVPRNLPLSTLGLSDLEIRFEQTLGLDHASTITCQAFSYRTDGTIAAQAERTAVLPASTGKSDIKRVSLDFGNAINASGSKGFYVVTCDLAPEVYLTSIYSSEEDGIAGN